jgi:hypothetical protein
MEAEMGRWLTAAREAEKAITGSGGTYKTFKTLLEPVVSVLSVGPEAAFGKSRGSQHARTEVHRCYCGSMGIFAEDWFMNDQKRARWFCARCNQL